MSDASCYAWGGRYANGIRVCIASVVVLVESVRFDPLSIEMPLNITSIMIWATLEVNFAIISGESTVQE